MIILAVGLKALLITGVLIGAGLPIARLSVGFKSDLPSVYKPALIALIIAAIGTPLLTIARLGAGFEPFIVETVLKSEAGLQAAILLVSALLALFIPLLRVPAALAMAIAFGVSGHSPSHADWLRPIISLHVLLAAWWTGGIILLLQSLRKDLSDDFANRVTRFGQQALPAVALLALAGVVDLLGLATDWPAFLASPYARLLGLKLAFVTAILSLAAWNRQRLTPAIQSGSLEARRHLKLSMQAELFIIAAIIVITALLTTTVSPFVGHSAGH